MSLLAAFTHGATGTWLDEIIQFGLPLLVLVILYVWSNRSDRGSGGKKEKR